MAAQDGSSVSLAYGAQGTQQRGDAVLLDYSAATGTRRLNASTVTPWRAAAFVRDPVDVPFSKAVEVWTKRAASWGRAASLRAHDGGVWARSTEQVRRAGVLWTMLGAPLHVVDAVPWAVAARVDDRVHAPWGGPMRAVQPRDEAVWGVAAKADQAAQALWRGPMRPIQPGLDIVYARSKAADHDFDVAWNRYTTQFAPSWSVLIPVHDSSAGLEALYVVPVQRVYMQVNTVSLRRVDTNAQLPTFSLSLSVDSSSWVWSFTAALPVDQQSAVEPVGGSPVELEAMVNGTPFRLFVDRIGRSREFGRQAISITGRGKASSLDGTSQSSIFQFDNASGARTAQQLMGDALAKSTIGSAWTVDWQAVDWLVPQGVWMYSGSQIAAINTIAAAAGLYVQAHASNETLSVLPQYPFAPWDWDGIAPDYELPVDVVTREGIEWNDKPIFNRVFVSGTAAGVLGQVTRTGTAGDLIAPMVADSLITHDDAARQRGRAILSDTGRIATLTLRLPVLSSTGVIQPGKFVRYLDGAVTRIGIVRSTSLEVSLPTVWQTIGVETHV